MKEKVEYKGVGRCVWKCKKRFRGRGLLSKREVSFGPFSMIQLFLWLRVESLFWSLNSRSNSGLSGNYRSHHSFELNAHHLLRTETLVFMGSTERSRRGTESLFTELYNDPLTLLVPTLHRSYPTVYPPLTIHSSRSNSTSNENKDNNRFGTQIEDFRSGKWLICWGHYWTFNV